MAWAKESSLWLLLLYDKYCRFLNDKQVKNCIYPHCKSALKPVPHDLDSPVPVPPEAAADESDDNSDDAMGDTDELYEPESEETKPQLLNQEELNDLVRDLSLSKEKAEVLGPRLQQWNLLEAGTKTSHFRDQPTSLAAFLR